jgi:Fe-Mn family superoxide dismutase
MSKIETYELPELGYEYDALEPAYSAELLELHYTKHHQAYVDGANATRESLAEARANGDFEKLNQLQKNLAFNVSGHILHSIFWRNMEPANDRSPSEVLEQEIDRAFGSLDALRGQFLAAGTSIQGSGWAALSWEPVSGSLMVEQVYDHQGNIGNGTMPLLVMDMWEHAFYLQYRNEKKRWAEAFWELINWRDVSGRLEGVRGVDLGTGAESGTQLKLAGGQQ